MNLKKALLSGTAFFVIGVLAWRWLGRTPTEADDPDHAATGEVGATAAIARVERRIIANTQLLSYEG
jgi:hypothetical protein